MSKPDGMFFDLIVATKGRRDSLPSLFESLSRQTHKNFRVLLVDQNPPGVLDAVHEQARSEFGLEVLYLRSSPGLSRARNVGLANLRGSAFALVDDDLTYEVDTLEKAAAALKVYDVAIGRLLEPGRPVPHQRKAPVLLRGIRGAFISAPSATLFFSRRVADSLPDGFLETIGVGTDSIYGSGAETDFLVRAMLRGFSVARVPTIIVRHPAMPMSGAAALEKARRYGRGRNYAIKKHQLGYGFVFLNAAHSLLKMLSRPGNADHLRYHWQMFLGRLGI